MPIPSSPEVTHSSRQNKSNKYPGISTVIHGNGAVAYVMGHVCGGVIGYPITPSTEISELYEAFRAQGGCNVWGQHPFFFEPEGEHSAQSGALGAALTGGKYISNASSSQGILYGLESHYVTVGKKAAGFVLQVAARSVSRHSLNVMAGHDDVYALLGAGYTILFGSNAQEAADLAAIAYKVSANSLIPVANAMDGFTTSHIQTEVALPEPELLKNFLGDPAERIPAPSESQVILYGAKGRVWQLRQFIEKHQSEFWPEQQAALEDWLDETTEDLEQETSEELIQQTLDWIPEALRPRWQRVWRNAYSKGTRQRVPALVDIHNPGLTGGVQNQPDYQAGIADHRAHFVSDVPCFVLQAMAEYESLTGRRYKPMMEYLCDDAERVIIGLGSVTDDAQAVAEYLRAQGEKVGVISVKLLQPFPEAQLVRLLAGKQAITVLERCDETRLTERVSRALIKAQENALAPRHMGVPALDVIPQIYTGIFGLGGHDLQPNHLIAAFANMAQSDGGKSLFYLGSQFYSDKAQGELQTLQERLKQAYPETKLMALKVGENPHLLPDGAMRIRFHSVGGYGTIATGKLLTDILAGVLSMHSKSAPKYGSEKSGAPTNFFITLSPEPIKLTNAELKQVEVVISPDHKVFFHTNPLAGLIKGGTFILQSHHGPELVWGELPAAARQQIQQNEIRFFVVDAFKVAKQHAPTADLQTRMMGIAFIGALCGHVEQVVSGADENQLLARIQTLIEKKFGAKGQNVVASNMAVIRDGLEATQEVNYQSLPEPEQESSLLSGISLSANLNQAANQAASCGLFDKAYFDCTMGDHYRDGTIGEAPVMPGSGMFMPAASAVWKEKGLFKLEVPLFDVDKCTGCMECSLACPDAALPLAVHDIHQLLGAALEQFAVPPAQKEALVVKLVSLSEQVREAIRQADKNEPFEFAEFVAQVVARLPSESATESGYLNQLAEQLKGLPLARTRPFFDAMEKAVSGTGGLFSVNLDPWKCSGCMECVDVCGPGALSRQRLSQDLTETFRHNFSFYSQLPNTPERFINDDCSDEELDAKRLLLDRDNYYAMASGHGACRGCGEVTALRLVTSINRALQQRRQRRHIQELEVLLHDLDEKRQQLAADSERTERLHRLMKVLEERLFAFESGPTGQGPASAIIANATGCSSVYASTFPANPYSDPWVNSLFQDSPALAKGLFEGEVATQLEQLKALRMARLELEDQYQTEHHDAYFRTLQWSQLTAQELSLLPTVMSVGGDGASYDIGFGALSRLLSTSTPIKVLVLNTGSYSNTGGQASTASYTAQDSDLSRVGQAHAGKQEARKELGLIATFHPKVMVIQTATVMQGHFMSNLMAYLNYQDSPALMDVYTPCLGEQGVGDDASARQARLAVESRMSPLFVHDPRKGTTLAQRFSIEGNPDWQQDWTQQSLTYVDDDGITQIKQTPLTPADFAFGEGRFKKHFTPLQQPEQGVELVDYLALSESQRHDKVPFIWVVDNKRHLKAMQISMAIVKLTQERRTNWRLLQHLSGLQLREMEQGYQAQLEQLQARYQQLQQEKEQTLDELASGMADLTLATGRAEQSIPITMVESAHDSPPKAAELKGQGASGEVPLVAIDESDMARCSDCKTCYQQLSELFEKTTIVVEGEAKTVGRVKPGALAAQPLTEELIARAARIADECDAEIIQFHAPVEA